MFFDWASYLAATGTKALPHSCFAEEQIGGAPAFSAVPIASEWLEMETSSAGSDSGRGWFRGGKRLEYWLPKMKLEALDTQHNIWGVATLQSLSDGVARLRFDKWTLEGESDLSAPLSSACLRPVGFAGGLGMALRPPRDLDQPFAWPWYLKECRAAAVPLAGFTPEQLNGFAHFPAVYPAPPSAKTETKTEPSPDRAKSAPPPQAQKTKSSACHVM